MYNRPASYEDIKELAADTGLAIPQLLALARNNDPFFAGSPAQVEKARWFANLWREFGYSTGVHLRRVHYRLVSQRNPQMHDGTRYENTERCWGYLCEAGKFARYLGLVSPEAFEDHRNPPAQIFLTERWGGADAEPSLGIYSPDFTVPGIPTDLAGDMSLTLPDPWVDGYDYVPADQAYHLEVWVEKSTMNDVLEPVCRRMGANLATSLGFQSITSVIGLLQRIAKRGKPARIFYVSDFDPAGDGMPVAVARQIEYWMETYGGEAEIKLIPLVLSKEQVIQYRLPRIPIKETDKRRGNFEDRYGEGAVELDALEALYPGTLADIIRDALAPYVDESLAGRLERMRRVALREVTDAWRKETEPERGELADLQAEIAAVLDSYQTRLVALSEALEEELAPLKEQLRAIQETVQDKANAFEHDLPERPEPETDADDWDDPAWLFDSNREYMDQLEVYKARKAGQNGNGNGYYE